MATYATPNRQSLNDGRLHVVSKKPASIGKTKRNMEAWRTKVDEFKASVHELGVVVEGEVLQVVKPPKKTNTRHIARADSNTNCCGSETAICEVEERDQADQDIKAAASHS